MARKFQVAIDLNKNELQNAVIQNLGSAPGTPVEGQIYYDTGTHKAYYRNNGAWIDMTGGAGSVTLSSTVASTQAFGDSATVGVGTTAARDDHKHAMPALGTSVTAETSYGSASNAGVATTASKSDHTHGTPSLSSNVASTQAFGDTATNGSGTAPAKDDHKHAMPGLGNVTAQTSYGASSNNGSASTASKSDHTHGTPSLSTNAASAQAPGDAAANGSGTLPAKDDHKHSLPGWGSVTAQTTFGASSNDGNGTTFARNNHTHGTPAHDASAHSAIKISDLAAPTATVSMGSQVVSNVATPSAATDAANKGYVDGVAAGLDFKNSVRVATTAAGTLATSFANGQTVDGVTLATNDRILLKNQASAAENGIYTVNAAGAPTRATDADANGEISQGSMTFVESGTVNGGQMWICTATGANPWVVNSSTSTWGLFFFVTATQAGAGLTASGNVLAVGASTGIVVNADNVQVDRTTNGGKVALIYAADVGDGAATSYVITHNLGSRDVGVAVYLNSGTYAEEVVDIEHTTTNTVTLRFATAPAAAAYRCVVFG